MARMIFGASSLLACAAVAQQPRQPSPAVNSYSIEKEIALGNQLADGFQRGTRALESTAALAYVSGIGNRLAAQMGGPPLAYQFALIADDPTAIHEVIAFPGGFLFVPASLILAANDEDELAGMLAHAIAHIVARDALRSAAKPAAGNTGAPRVYMGGRTGYATPQGQAPVIPVGMLPTWRSHELDADRLAARAMAAAGYDPAALARYIERVQRPDEIEPGMSALPQRSDRVRAIRDVIGRLPAQAYRPHEGFEKVQEEVRRLTATAPHAPPTLSR
jgi:predicted Zn-dependent protease